MHSLNHAGWAASSPMSAANGTRSVRYPGRPERPPNVPVRGRVAYAAGRIARKLDREMAQRAVA